MDKILFLGSNSFTGLYFKKYIIENNLVGTYKFIGVDKDDVEKYSFKNIKYRKLNILNFFELGEFIEYEKPTYILNFVGIFKGNLYEEYLKINCEITRNIFEIILKKNIKSIKNILLIGSAAEYGNIKKLPIEEVDATNPINFYGVSKVFQTILANYYFNNFGIKNNVARTFNIIGKGLSNDLSIGSFLQQIEKCKDGDEIVVGNLNTKRDFLDVEDVIDAYWKILINGHDGEIYNVCMGQSYKIGDILNKLITDSAKKLEIVINNDYIRKNDIYDIYGSNYKLKEQLKWKPVNSIIK